MSKVAFITGISGMDGSHLADFLLNKGYQVYGMERRKATKVHDNIKHLEDKIEILNGDLTDQNSLLRCLQECNPDEVYNLAAQSFVGESWNTPEQTSDVTGLGVLRMLEAIRMYDTDNRIKFYQASSSEMFGRMIQNPADENTPFYPRSPYGIAKLYGHWITKNYRESYGMFTCSGILFNHESERRGFEFVTRKITSGVAKIYTGKEDFITLGNLEAKRDWGYAPDYVEAMWMMMQSNNPDDYVIATGKTYSIKAFLTSAFNCIGIDDWSKYVKTDPKYMRPAEVDVLRGNATKARIELGWEPRTGLNDMIKKMVFNDIKILS